LAIQELPAQSMLITSLVIVLSCPLSMLATTRKRSSTCQQLTRYGLSLGSGCATHGRVALCSPHSSATIRHALKPLVDDHCRLQSNFYAAGMTAALDEFHAQWLRVTGGMVLESNNSDQRKMAELEMIVAQAAKVVNHACDPHDRVDIGLPARSVWNWLATPRVPAPVATSLNELSPSDAGGVVFGDLNFNNKIEPVMFGVWMSILSRVPGSVLLLQTPTRETQATAVLPGHLWAEAASRGIHASRIVFAPR
jgi:hypothetical protein